MYKAVMAGKSFRQALLSFLYWNGKEWNHEISDQGNCACCRGIECPCRLRSLRAAASLSGSLRSTGTEVLPAGARLRATRSGVCRTPGDLWIQFRMAGRARGASQVMMPSMRSAEHHGKHGSIVNDQQGDRHRPHQGVCLEPVEYRHLIDIYSCNKKPASRSCMRVFFLAERVLHPTRIGGGAASRVRLAQSGSANS